MLKTVRLEGGLTVWMFIEFKIDRVKLYGAPNVFLLFRVVIFVYNQNKYGYM